jgi:hypothetical protein
MDGSPLFNYLIMCLVVAGIAAAYGLFVSRSEGRGIDRSYRERIPLRQRLARRFGSRRVGEFEWSARFTEAPPGLEITFFVEELPTAFQFDLAASTPFRIEGLRYQRDDGPPEPQDFTRRIDVRDGGRRISLAPLEVKAVRRVEFRLAGPPLQFQGQLVIHARRREQPDLRIVADAERLAESHGLSAAIRRLRDYEQFSRENPSVCYRLAEWSLAEGALDDARDYVARGLARGDVEPFVHLYETIQKRDAGLNVEDVRRLQADAREWTLPSHHGAIVLDRQQTFSLELSGGHLRRSREILEIRRPAAARMLRQLQFPFSESRDQILHSSLSVVHASGEIEEVPAEHFTILDDESRDLFITVEGEKSGHWILPDLEVGDVICWTHDLYRRDRTLDEGPRSFNLSFPYHDVFPTHRAVSRFVVPPDASVRFAVRNLDPEHDSRQDDGRTLHVFEGSNYIPAKGTGFAHENELLNPVIAYGFAEPDWASVAARALADNFGTEVGEETLPEDLRALLDGAGDPADALATTFYWIRDRLKYAAMHSGRTRIGDADRARRILDAGVADCKDKSYLLGLICRELGIPCEFVAVSTKTGIVIEELPADQFDHVFLRADVGGEWKWLDASNPTSTFESPPARAQGISALTLNGDPSIVEVPTAPPEANTIDLEESFDRYRDGRIEGAFEVRARGQSARLMDENWKAMSLMFDERIQAGQEALKHYLPASIVADYSRLLDTSDSDRFRIEGHHSRGPLTQLGRQPHLIGTLSWDIPFLPISYWRTLQIERLFFVELATKLSLSVRLEGSLLRALEDVSHIEALDNAVGSVNEEVLDEPDSRTIRRTIILKKKFVRDEELELVPPTLERVENAMQLVLAIDPSRL